MAIIKLGALTQDVRGTLNGSVFSRNRGGSYIRTKVSPVQPISRWSSLTRSLFKAAAQYWSSTLSDQQRLAWEAWAAIHPIVNVFGDSIILPGVAAFTSINTRILMISEDILESPPPTFIVEDLGLLTIVATVATGTLTLSITPARTLEADEGLYVSATPPLGNARALQNNDLGLVTAVPRILCKTPFTLGGAIMLRFPCVTWAVGQRIGLRVAGMSETTGALSSPISQVVTTTAPA